MRSRRALYTPVILSILLFALFIPRGIPATKNDSVGHLLIENEFLRVSIDPKQDFGTLRSFFNKMTGKELSCTTINNIDGAAALRTGLGRRLWRHPNAHQFLAKKEEEGPEHTQILRSSFRWTGEIKGSDYDFLFEVKYSLKAGESRLRVDWKISNLAGESRPVSAWLHGIMLQRGKFYTVVPEGFGDGRRPRGNGFFSPVTNWMANTGEQTYFTAVELSKVHEYYMWTDSEFSGSKLPYTLEVIYQQEYLPPGGTWQTTFFLGMALPLPNVAFACPEAAIAMEPLLAEKTGPQDVSISIAPVKTLGAVRLEGNLRRKGQSIMPLAPRRINWQAGQMESIRYSLQVPEEGAYQLELNIYQEGEQYPLGNEIGAYRRYIEIPLQVGKLAEGEEVLPPWPRTEIKARNIVGRLLKLPLLAEDEHMRIGLAHPTERVFREDTLHSEAQVQSAGIEKALAAGEWESIPIVVFPKNRQGLSNVWLTISPLRQEGRKGIIPQNHFRLYRVASLYTKQASRFLDYPVGHYPDPLYPLKYPQDLSGDRNTVFWLNIQAPLTAEAGLYTGTIHLQYHEGSIEIPLKLRVWNFRLPSPPALKTWAGAVGFNIKAQMQQLGLEEYNAAEIREQFIRLCLDYGFNPGHGARYTEEEVKTWETYNRGFTVLPNIGVKGSHGWATQKTLQKHGWEQKAYIYAPFDEHSKEAMPDVVRWAQDWRRDNPHIKILDVYYGSYTEPLHGLVDVWCRDLQRDSWTRERMQAGDEFWRVNAPLIWGVEDNLLEGRADYWKIWSHEYTGQLLWSVIAWGNKTRPDYRGLGSNALALNLFPIPNGVVPTIRWENMRDGLEDYEYFYLLKKFTLAYEARAGQDELSRGARALWTDPEVHIRCQSREALELLRMEIARLCEQLQEHGK
ncbi:MAG: DUF4091 domain-containing protein [Lentisphaeria bacterium]|nr:DUF4091 domain-containing protein [Lentisphaeria bacterium]